jgi:hypothetical protein
MSTPKTEADRIDEAANKACDQDCARDKCAPYCPRVSTFKDGISWRDANPSEELIEARKVIAFYGNHRNWREGVCKELSEIASDQSALNFYEDDEKMYKGNNWSGGKRAREYLKRFGNG